MLHSVKIYDMRAKPLLLVSSGGRYCTSEHESAYLTLVDERGCLRSRSRRGGQACIVGKPAPVALCRGPVTRPTNVKYALSLREVPCWTQMAQDAPVEGTGETDTVPKARRETNNIYLPRLQYSRFAQIWPSWTNGGRLSA